ncbi:hypothetical protein GSI_08470 [Ganoderma sinense ZZ0214-1]|uniref:Uncharacterized protein n=1 Tax=Ganoderma sinense ZZ0214-1 TaxID=1077348 RepID=A0A2G8S3T6_9APHY|nr:hypothetical protein GSI_08470 [Ganoderma sinense ZZ0214-1]
MAPQPDDKIHERGYIDVSSTASTSCSLVFQHSIPLSCPTCTHPLLMPSDSIAREGNPSLSPLPAGPPATSSHSSDGTTANDQDPVEHDAPPEVVPIAPGSLQANMKGDPRASFTDAFTGIVAAQAYTAQGWDSNIVVTSPNADWVPEFAVAHSEITTFADGRWGRHEYSRWPQQFAREAFHIHCIPSKPRPDGPREILWRTLDRTDWKPDDCGIPGVGFLNKQLQNDLLQEVESVISCYFRCNDGSAGAGWNKIGAFLTVCLQHTVDRLRSIPAVPGVIVSLAAHVQRLTLELSGLIEWLKEVSKRVASVDDYSWTVLDVLGAYTADPSIAQVLYRAGIPVWLQRERNTRIEIYKVVTAMDIPPDFSQIPSYPRLVLAKRDLSGALNLPGEWGTAMAEIVRRQLCASQVPKLLEEEKDAALPPAKRLREGVAWVGSDSSSVGAAKPVFITRASQHAKTLQHVLPPAPPLLSSQLAPGPSNANPATKKPSRRARARQAKAQSNQDQANGFATIPSRQYYPSLHLSIAPSWALALSTVSPLHQPQVSVKYFSAPPWLLDTLQGFEGYPEKTTRYLHHWVSIRAFCRVRLFDSTVAGRPLTIAEWRDALWGEYNIADPLESSSEHSSGRPKLRHELQVNIRRLFGQGASLPSYHVDASPQFGNTLVTLEVARSDLSTRSSVVWDAYETNWRCELLALDALMVGSNDWTELNRWMRESLVSQVWGSGTSGIDVVPPIEPLVHQYCWLEPPQEGWEACRRYLKPFVEVLGRWEGLPSELRGAHERVMDCGADEYAGILGAAVSFYVAVVSSQLASSVMPPVTIQVLAVRSPYSSFWSSVPTYQWSLLPPLLRPLPARPSKMGAMKWRAQELIFLDKVAASEEGRAQLKKSNTDRHEGRTYWFRNATNLFVKKYRDEFPHCFKEETTVEFAYRQQRQPHAKLQPYPEETEAERVARLDTVNKRIESWLKGHSDNSSRRKRSNGRASGVQPATNETIAAAASLPASTAVNPPTLGTSVDQLSSAHTVQGLHRFGLLTGADTRPELSTNGANVLSTPRSAIPTDEQLYKVLSLLKEIQLTLMKDRGWVGWCLFGGLDGRGDFGSFDHCTAYDRAGVSFEEFLANKLGVTVNGLLAIFDNFVGSSFGLPPRTLEASSMGNSRVNAGRLVSSALPLRDVSTIQPATPTHAPPYAPTSVAVSRSPYALNFDSPVTALPSLSFSPIPSPSDDSLGVSAPVAVDPLLVSSPAARSDESLHTPPMSTTMSTTVQNHQLITDSPRVVFGTPPARVLTTAPEKPPVKRRRGRVTVAHVRSGGNRKNNIAKTKAHKPAASKPSPPAAGPSPEVHTDMPEQLADVASSALGRGKRLRVSTAKALDQSPDMSAANKLRRRADELLRVTTETTEHHEASERQVKRRKC